MMQDIDPPHTPQADPQFHLTNGAQPLTNAFCRNMTFWFVPAAPQAPASRSVMACHGKVLEAEEERTLGRGTKLDRAVILNDARASGRDGE